MLQKRSQLSTRGSRSPLIHPKATTQTNSKEKKATMADKVDVLKKVAERIEFFFSDANFRKDE